MKRIMIAVAAALTLASCGSDQQKVKYLSGKMEYVEDYVVKPDSGDTIVVEHSIFISKLGISDRSKIWGIYEGELPKEQFQSDSVRTSRTWYEIAIAW